MEIKNFSINQSIFMAVALPSPMHPVFRKQDINLHTDKINTPTPPVGGSHILIL
jgi:hypothetical protein